jgi:hypothetical protein
LHPSPNVIRMVKSRRMRWVGQVVGRVRILWKARRKEPNEKDLAV